MTSYILLERIKIEDANCIAGVTYGFPAVTHFLGFTHALSRKCKEQFGFALQGCAIFCHQYQLHTNEQFDVRFIQNKRPPVTLFGDKYRTDAKSTPPIIEEGKMDMTVSLLLQCDGMISGQDDLQAQYKTQFEQWIYHLRLAGGTIHHLKNVRFLNDTIDIKKIKRQLLPSFVLLDATHEFEQYINRIKESEPNKELFDIWTDFFALKQFALKQSSSNEQAQDLDDEKTEIEWTRQTRPKAKGWFVPLMIGYKGISTLYDPADVENSRDTCTPFRFVESVHSIGEWRSSHHIHNLADLIWHYHHEDEWYLCQQHSSSQTLSDPVVEQLVNNDSISDSIDHFYNSL